MADQQPPPFILLRILKERGHSYGTGWMLVGVMGVTAALLVLAWLLTR